MAETAKLAVDLSFKSNAGTVLGGVNRQLGSVNASTSKLHKGFSALGTGIGTAIKAGTVVAIGAIGLLGAAIRAGVSSLEAEGVVVAQTEAVIKSTGAVANVTAAQIRDLSQAMEAKTTIDDKLVQADANLLLTFTNVRNEAGKGNNIFDRTVSVFEDMKTAMPSSNMVQLGKALNDPVKGLTALTKVGVTFTAEQAATIKGLVGEGDALKNLKGAGIELSKAQTALIKSYGPVVDTIAAAEGAHVKLTKAQRKTFEGMSDGTGIIKSQKIILGELAKEFGGSGAAFAATDAGKAAKFQDAIEGIQQSLARGLLPAITRVRGQLTDFLSNPATMSQATALGDSIAAIFSEGNLRTAASLMTTAANAVGTAIRLFSGLPKEVQALAVGALALKKITGIGVTDVVGSALKGLNLFQRGGTPANPLFVADVAGGAGAGAAGATGIWSKVGKVIGGAFAVVAVASIADALYPMISEGGGYQNRVQNGTDTLPADQLSWPWGPKNTPKVDFDLGPFHMGNILGGDSGITPAPTAPVANIFAGSPVLPDDLRNIAQRGGRITPAAQTLLTRAGERGDANASKMAAIIGRAFDHGKVGITMSGIRATLAKNDAVKATQAAASKTAAAVFAGAEKTSLRLLDVVTAVNGLKPSEPRDSRPPVVNVTVNTNISVRDTLVRVQSFNHYASPNAARTVPTLA